MCHWFTKPFRVKCTAQQNTTYTLHYVPIKQSKLSFHPYLTPLCPYFKYCHFFCVLLAKASQKPDPDSGGRITDFTSDYHFPLTWPGPQPDTGRRKGQRPFLQRPHNLFHDFSRMYWKHLNVSCCCILWSCSSSYIAWVHFLDLEETDHFYTKGFY